MLTWLKHGNDDNWNTYLKYDINNNEIFII